MDLKALIKSDIKFKMIWESSCKNHRVLYFQINKEDNGIEAHFHPYGEDHALILEGELKYDISFQEQIVVNQNSLVFGWTNYVHGYHNLNDKPLHILVFATPQNNLSVYNQGEHPIEEYTAIRKNEKLKELGRVSSKRITFSTIPPKDFTNSLLIDLEHQMVEFGPCKLNNNRNNLFVSFKVFD